MLSGFYTISSGILQQERTINVLSNNIANARTPGFRASRVVSTTFDHEFMIRLEKNNNGALGTTSPIRVMAEVPVRWDSGGLEQTERPYDMAIEGPGFFQIQAADGQRYLTRNGNFDLDDQGYLILRGGGQVLSKTGAPIRLQNADFTVNPDGNIIGANGNNMGSIGVVTVPDDAELTPNPNGLYTAEDMNNLPQSTVSNVAQGWLEQSNMEVTHEYTLVMEAQRAFQACSTALQVIDRLNQKSATQIASV